MPLIRLAAFLLLLIAAPASAATLNVGPAGTPYTAAQARGFWFTAPSDFVITSLNVPGGGNQNIQVVRFTAIPPAFSASTTAHTTLYSTVNNSSAGPITVSVAVETGDIIGILGTRGPNGGTVTNSYGSSNTFATTIDGNPVVLSRLLYQSSSLPAGALSTENGTYSRVEVTYEPSLSVPNGTATGTYSGAYRGTWFTAPVGMVVTGLSVPGSGNQNLQMVRFNSGVPPNFGASTTGHTTLFSTTNDSTVNWIPTSVTVAAGDVIGILGARGSNGGPITVSYGQSSPVASTIGGVATNLNRLVYQSTSLNSGALSNENGGSLGRIDIRYYTTSTGPTNQAPVASLATASGNEGAFIVANGSGSTDDGTIVLWSVDCDGNGTYETTSGTATGATCAFVDDGSYSVGLQVTDDGGLTDTTTATFTVTNVAPAVTVSVPGTADLGIAASLSGSFTDVGTADTHTYLWDFGDGGTNSTSLTPTHTWASNGTFLVSLTVTDDDGGVGVATANIVVQNDPPVTNAGPNQSGVEGQTLSFAGSFTDAGSGHTYLWVFGDGATSSASLTPTHTYVDDGTFTVSLSVTDAGGLTNTDTLTATIANVSPTITSTPTTTAVESSTWTYSAAATDPGTSDTLTWSTSGSTPAWVSVSPLGVVSGTPPLGSAGQHAITVDVSDGDGGADSQSFVLDVDFLDTDLDGLPDSWELDNNLDLTDPADAANDPDGDGVSNLDEFLGGTDPNSFDGPSAATLVSPIEDAEVDVTAVDLVFEAATDPQGDTLTYTVEIYSDASLTTLVATFDDVAEGVGTTTVTTDALDENAEYAWRVQAEDSFVGGSWTDPEGFFVNAINEPPDTPTLLFPVNDEPVDTLRPAFEWTDFADVDRDGGTTTLEVEDTGDGSLVASVVVGGERDVATLDVDLTEDAHYRWRVQPTDEHGLASDWSEYATFGVDTTNAAPSPVMFVSPEDGETVTEVLFEATESEDAEGDTITYAFEVDSAIGFDSGSAMTTTVPHSGTGIVRWDPAASGDTLGEGEWFARVRAEDDRGAGSEWDTITFVIPETERDSPATDIGCACRSSVAPDAADLPWMLGLLVAMGLRRRRS
jgi:PKD repeat protein